MHFPTTNFKRKDHDRVMFLMHWKYPHLERDCCELWKVEEKLFLAEELQMYFEVVFPGFYVKIAIGKLFSCICVKNTQKNQIRKAIFN